MKLGLVGRVALATAGVMAAAVIAPMMEVEGFKDYKPPNYLNVERYDYYDGRSGSNYGAPADGSRDTDVPTWQLDYPHRAFFFGGQPGSSDTQKHDTRIYVVLSKEPVLDCFTFTWRGTKTNSQTGYIRADFSAGRDILGDGKTMRILYLGFRGVDASSARVPFYNMSNYVASQNNYRFDFDFYYQCCGDLQIEGLRSIMEATYPYILTCTDQNGNGGGSTGPSESGGGSSGGGSSGGDGSGSSGGGDGSGGSSGGGDGSGGGKEPGDGDCGCGGSDCSCGSQRPGCGCGGGTGSGCDCEWWEVGGDRPGPWDEDGSYPWQDDKNLPNFDWSISEPPYANGGTDGHGEQGDTWTLPEWAISGPPFTDRNVSVPSFPVPGMRESMPDIPLPNLRESMPELPGQGSMQESYPAPALPYGWPPPMPGPGQ